jgi:diguanylate cyclase (GGDEF)-like protein
MTDESSTPSEPPPARLANLWALGLPLAFLAAQVAIFVAVPAISAATAYLAMTAAPFLAGIACAVRARREMGSARIGWAALGLGVVIWSAGSFGNLWQEWVLGHVNEMYRSSMLAFNLATVPIAFLLASEWRPLGRRQLVRVIDAGVALALGLVYFLTTWSLINDRALPQEEGVAYLVWLIDAQNFFLCAGAWVRWHAASDRAERDLFRSLSVYFLVFFSIVFINDHFFAGNPDLGPEYGSIVTLAFALLSALALLGPGRTPLRAAPASTTRAVRSASPAVLAGALLIVSLFLIRVEYAYGCAGVLIAVIGYGARSTVAQVRHIKRGDLLQRQRSELQAIAWTDPLTGLANRRFLDHAMRRAWRTEVQANRAMAILMIDVDHFKLLNDHYGHLAGDACLREVASVLQQNLVRPDDVLARYGGEEFIAVLLSIDLAGAQVVAERLRAAVKERKLENTHCPQGIVTVSIGVACAILDHDFPPERLVDIADRALYAAKCAGRDRTCSLLA